MWGAATHDRATGVHRLLTATALVLRPCDETRADDEVVFIAVDHCLLWGREMDQLLGSVASATGAARERLLVAFSHTHAASGKTYVTHSNPKRQRGPLEHHPSLTLRVGMLSPCRSP
jgi:hypothetical protein